MKRNAAEVVNVCMHQAPRHPGLAQGSESFHHGYKSPNESKAMASRDKIGALDKEDGGNGGEASCEKGASNSAGRSRERSNRSARCGRLGDAVKGN